MSSHARTVAGAALGISLFAATGYLVYMLLRREEDDLYESVPTSNAQTKLELRIPRENVRTVIGRNGATIKQIENRTRTKINFRDAHKGDGHRVCVVRGLTQDCINAENLIYEMIASQPVIECRDVWVPRACVGRIIGRNGERIHHLTQVSGAKIVISAGPEAPDAADKRILLKGTAEQIEVAASCILDVVRDDLELRRRVDARLARREPRGRPRAVPAGSRPHEQLAQAADAAGQMEVYVSAVVDPSRFWLQIVGPNANELDQLVEDMTDYYGRPEARELHALPDPQPGELVAAAFQYDAKWYRAEVRSLQGAGAADATATLYYVDYGDTDTVPASQLLELRTDFLRLRFQAIECYLARARPAGDGAAAAGRWSTLATDRFEEWTHVAQWKKLRARVHGYRAVSAGDDGGGGGGGGRARRERSPVPGVDLYDVGQRDDVDIAAKLVAHGLARFADDGDADAEGERALTNGDAASASASDSADDSEPPADAAPRPSDG